MKDIQILRPFRVVVYRRIWSASLLSNFGQLIQGVGAAWAMTQLTNDMTTVALVQTASYLPIMLWSIPAGAIADSYDQRKICLTGLSVALTSAIVLWIVTWRGYTTPIVLLGFCFLVGSGMAIYSPAWQSSVAQQVPREMLPQAIALNSISYNIARSFGPAIGGTIVALFGTAAAFLSNALLYVPLIVVLTLWRRTHVPSRLPPERVDRAVVSGLRYILHSPSIRVVLIRTFFVALLGASILALMPLIARTLLRGGPLVFGILLGSFGIGAIGGALLVTTARRALSGEMSVRSCSAIMGIAIILVGQSRTTALTGALLFAIGGMWMLNIALFNVSVQTLAPRWVSGRTLAAFQASVTGAAALGSWLWGHVAQQGGISIALYSSGALMLGSPLFGLRYRMPESVAPIEEALVTISDPDVSLAITGRSGPIIIEIEYCVPPDHAREFYRVMQKIELIRKRNGAYGWSIARDLANAGLWTERFHCPTWLDYLRLRSRPTQVERDLQALASGYHQGETAIQIRRMLERPFGSVRWDKDTMDTGRSGFTPPV
jgi:MFS family permease